MEPNQEQDKQKEQGKVLGPAFDLPISDDDFADIVDKRIIAIEKKQRDLKLDERTKEMENFWLGKQVDESGMYDFQIPYVDNLIFRDEETRIAIISSKLPDIIVTPADQTKEKMDHSSVLEKGLTIRINNDVIRRLIKDGLRNHDLYLRACIKVRWDRNIDNYVFELVNPKKILFDHTATIPQDGFTADNMEVIVEWIERPVAQVIADFPDKKQEILEANGWVRGTAKQVNSKMRYQEIWFSFYGDDGKLYEGTGWKINKTVLGKQRNAYFDWEGYEKAQKDQEKQLMFRNHFDRPRKPYIFFTYQNLGNGPIDDTSHVEQAIPGQRIVNKRGRQITEIADRTVPKLAALADAISKEDLRRITNDPDEHISLGGNVQDIRAAIMSIVATGPSPVLYNDLITNRMEIDALFATHSTTRGEKAPGESGVSKQITREGDLASHDDMSKVVVERVVFEMASWAVQLMKMFYEKEHFEKNLGKDGEGVYVELKRDIIDDGISLNVQSSSVDKAQRRFDAQTSAARRQIDPLSYWEDLDVPNPKERTRRLIAFLSGDFKTYFDITDLAGPDEKDQGKKEAEVDIERIKEGDDFEPSTPTPLYLITMKLYADSEDYKKLPDKIKNRFKVFVKKLRDKYEKDYLVQIEKEEAGIAGEGGPGTPAGPQGPGQPLAGTPAQPSVNPVSGGGTPPGGQMPM